MRGYFFGNFYLSSIQQGIQATHALARMFSKYRFDNAVLPIYDWVENHETLILLNGGDALALEDMTYVFNTDDNPYSWGYFNESKDALNSAITSVGIILPEKIYMGAEYYKFRNFANWSNKTIDEVVVCKDKEDGGVHMLVLLGDVVTFEQTYTKFERWFLENLPRFSLAR